MKALFLKDIYTTRFQFMLMLSVYIVCQTVLITEGVILAIYLSGFYSLLLFFTVYHDMFVSDEKVKWNTFMLSLPIGRRRIVDEKFVVLMILLFMVFALHIIVLSLAFTFSDSVDHEKVLLGLSIEVPVLIILCAIGISAFVSGLLSAGKFERILPTLIIMVASIICATVVHRIMSTVLNTVFITLGVIVKYYSLTLLCLLPVIAGAYIYCRIGIGRREY